MYVELSHMHSGEDAHCDDDSHVNNRGSSFQVTDLLITQMCILFSVMF